MTPKVVYQILGYYLDDHAQELGPDLMKVLVGWKRSRDLRKLASASDLFDPNIHGLICFKHLRQIEALFKKNSAFVGDDDCREAALASFADAEKRCRIANRRLDHYYHYRERLRKKDAQMEWWLGRMERVIADTLRPFERFLEDLPSKIRVTSGATATRKRAESQRHRKMTRKLTCSARAAPYLEALASFYGVDGFETKRHEYNRVALVPKSFKTHRTIACEPDGNLPLQLAADAEIKDCLLRLGVDLSSQDRNQRYAKIGSELDSLATIDLSAASDSLALNAVAWLFPRDWFKFLNDVRSHVYTLPDKTTGVYAKFSSMGNGATFTLETLVFTAACIAVGSETHSVYGDDIIIEQIWVDDLVRLLAFLGFKVNREKSFTKGPFRESCGADYYHGSLVTPFYWRKLPKRPSGPEACHLLNGLVSIGRPEGRIWQWCRDYTRKHRIPRVPFNLSTTQGIWIDPTSAYDQGLIRHPKHTRNGVRYVEQVPSYRGFSEVTRTTTVRTPRTLFLWYLTVFGQESRELPSANVQNARRLLFHRGFTTHFEPFTAETTECSKVPVSHPRVKYGWLRWDPPPQVTPAHLFWWAEFLSSPSTAS